MKQHCYLHAVKKIRKGLSHMTFEYEQLVILAQTGNRTAFGELVKLFQSRVYATVMYRLRNSAEAQEVTQEVFLRAMRKIDQLREPQRFPGWLLRIAVRLSINRAMRKPAEISQDGEVMGQYGETGEQPEDRLLAFEQAERVQAGISKLKPMDRDTLMAFYFQGQSLQEMSRRFDSPVGTIKRRLHTARHRLKEHLDELQMV
jgi:RNA polymerase sigma-70 factor (ECF subfamily)